MENDVLDHELETRIISLARAFPYPATPTVAGQTRPPLRGGSRHWRASTSPAWAWALALIVVVLTGLMAVPSVRAAVLEFIQIGALRIFPNEEIPPLPTPESSPTPLAQPAAQATLKPAPTYSTSAPLTSVLALAGETTLETAREYIPFPIHLPTFPADLGAPDKVFYQDLQGGWGLFLVWFDAEQPDQVRLSLLLLAPGAFAGKGGPDTLQETTVNGERAIWMEGEHFLVLQTGPNQYDFVQLFVQGNVLVWEIDGITYRLESELSMEDVIRIAESMK